MITSVMQKLALDLTNDRPPTFLDRHGAYAIPMLYGAGIGAGIGGIAAYKNDVLEKQKAVEDAQAFLDRTRNRVRPDLRKAREEKQRAEEALRSFMKSPVSDPKKQTELNARLSAATKKFDLEGRNTLNSMHGARKRLAAAKKSMEAGSLGTAALGAGKWGLAGALGAGALLYGSNLLNKHEWDS